jgi:hypothetical protein
MGVYIYAWLLVFVGSTSVVGKNMLVEELLGKPLQTITRSYWAVKLDNDRWVCEAHTITDLRKGEQRLTDWTNDLVSSDDVLRVKEVWLLCPPNKLSPLGNTAMFPITRPGSVFQFKFGMVDSGIAGPSYQHMEGHIIGRVTNEQGDCECYVWDAFYEVLGTGWKTNIHNIGTWRSGLMPMGALDLMQLGVTL